MEQMEGVTPDCEQDGKACLVPPLCAEGQRIMEIYTTLRSLSGLVDSSAIFSLLEVGREDLEILVLIETEYKKAQPSATA